MVIVLAREELLSPHLVASLEHAPNCPTKRSDVSWVDDTDADVEWKRGTGEIRDADSRHRKRSLALPTVCNEGPSSTSGDDAPLVCPADIPGEYPSGPASSI